MTVRNAMKRFNIRNTIFLPTLDLRAISFEFYQQQLSYNESKNIIGFQGGICENCFSPFFYEVSGKQKMIPRPQAKLAHRCDAKDVSDAKSVLDIQSKREQIHVCLTNMLLQTVLRIITWSGRRTISLKAEELVPTSYLSGLEDTENNLQLDGNTEDSLISTKEEDHVDIDLEGIGENRSANHIFKEKGQGEERLIVLRLDELLDFIHTTDATFGVFRIKREMKILEPNDTSFYILYSRS
jgi:hypothetical protein